jgi:hypothetical protein
LLVVVFFQPLVVGSFFPAALSELTRVSPKNAENLAVALAIPLANLLGSGMVPRAMGAAGEAGHFNIAFLVLGVAIILSIGLTPFLRGVAPDRAS